MQRFFAKLLLFAAPFLVVLAPPLAVLTVSGELDGVDGVVELQATSPTEVLFGLSYSDPTAYYKLKAVLLRKPEVLALGTSRILAVRAEFLRDGGRFYNAGNAVTRLRHFRPFLERIPRGAEPKVILLGLDQYLFNANFDSLAADGMEAQWAADRKATDVFFDSWKQVYEDWHGGKFALAQVFGKRRGSRLGINAIVHANAFRNDGSYSWAKHAAAPDSPEALDPGFSNTLDRIAKGNRRFQYGREVSGAAVAELEAFLAECRARGIHVAAFLPPFAHVIHAKLASMPVEYGYLREVYPRLAPVFARFGYPLFDFSDLATVGASDRETVDGFHGSETAYLRLFVRMAEADSGLGAYARDTGYLKRILAATKSSQTVFTTAEN